MKVFKFFGVIIFLVTAIFLFFSFRDIFEKKDAVPKKDSLTKAFQELGEGVLDSVDTVKRNAENVKGIFETLSDTTTTVEVSEEELKTLAGKILQRTEIRKFLTVLEEKFSSEHKDILSVKSPQNPVSIFSPLIEWQITGVKTCFVCDDAECEEKQRATNILLSFYLPERALEIEEFLQNQNSDERQCISEIVFQSEKFIVLNNCINDQQCEDAAEINEKIENFFNTYAKEETTESRKTDQ